MSKSLKIILSVLAGIGVSVLIFKACKNPNKITIEGKKYTVIKTRVDTLYIDKIVERIKTVPKIVKIIETKTDTVKLREFITVYKLVDSSAIIADYVKTYIYEDTLHLTDNLGYVAITDTVSKNKIVSRYYEQYLSTPVITVSNYLAPKLKNQLNFGVAAQFGSIGRGLGPNITLVTKKKATLSASVLINGQIVPSYVISYSRPIRFK
jgi:hypothetical protein